MAGNKIFYVTRTETEGQPAGAATLHRGDKPQLLKIVGVDHAGNPDPATPEDNQIYATEEENQEILFVSDTVQAGDYNPVTSDAVFNYAKPPRPDWGNAIAITTITYTMPADGLLVGVWWEASSSNTGNELKINGIRVSQNKANDGMKLGVVQVPVSSGDSMALTGGTNPQVSMNFIPWKI